MIFRTGRRRRWSELELGRNGWSWGAGVRVPALPDFGVVLIHYFKLVELRDLGHSLGTFKTR